MHGQREFHTEVCWRTLRGCGLGSHLDLGTQILTGGSYSWTGARRLFLHSSNGDECPAHCRVNIFTQTYTNTVGASSTETFTITLN
jgi:hypothetical protein